MKSKKIFGLFSIIVLIGIICFAIGISLGGSFEGIYLTRQGLRLDSNEDADAENALEDSNVRHEEEVDEFDSIDVKVNYANVKLIVSDHYGVEYCMPSVSIPKYEIKNGTLYLESSAYKNKNWNLKLFGHAHNNESSENMNSENEKSNNKNLIYIYIPKNTPGKSMDITLTSGTITLDDCIFKKVKIENDFGDLSFAGLTAEDVFIDIKSGCIKGESIYSRKARIEPSFSDVSIGKIESHNLTMDFNCASFNADEIAGGEAEIVCSFGELNIDSLSVKEAHIKNTFGETNIEGVESEEIDINTSFGEINVSLKDISAYNMDCRTDFGEVCIDNESKGGSYTVSSADTKKEIDARCTFGEVNIK